MASGSSELYYIKQELNSIIRELDSIKVGINTDFNGIGEEKCSASVAGGTDMCQSIKRRLNNMNTSKVSII